MKRHVPKGARHACSQCLVTALAKTVETNDVASWTELFALPKMVLAAGRRGGKGHAKRLEAETKRRCRMWLEGHRSQLWDDEGMNPPGEAAQSHRTGTNVTSEPASYCRKACTTTLAVRLWVRRRPK